MGGPIDSRGMLCDFHIHSNFSDGKLSIPEIVDLFGSHGFGAIAITDHLCEEESLIGKAAYYLNKTLTRANFPLYQEILKSEAERAWKKYRMLVIPGMELTKNTLGFHRSAHMLALGVSEWISADLNVLDMAKAIREKGGLCIAAHPLDVGRRPESEYLMWSMRDDLKPYVDAWEITHNRRLLVKVAESSLPKLATSDFHRRTHFKGWRSLVYSEPHPEAIFEAIRKQKVGFFYLDEDVVNDEFASDFLVPHYGARVLGQPDYAEAS